MERNKKRELEEEQLLQRKEGEELPSTSYALPLSPTASASASEFRNWAELPELVLHSILTRLLTSNPDLADFLSFSSVCRSWKSTSATYPTSFPPLLLLPGNPNRRPRRYRPSFCRLQTLLTGRTFQSKITPKTLTLTSIGYSNGRLILLPPRRRNLLLADVFTGELTRIRPPPSDYHFRLALFANQNLFLLTVNSLFSYRPITNSWSSVDNTDPSGYIVSLAFHQGKLFGFDSMSRLIVVDLGGAEDETFIGGWMLMEVAAPVEQPGEPAVLFSTFRHRLVECGRELLLLRLNKLSQPIRCRITVYRLDFERLVWVQKESLGDWCMFLDTVGHCPVVCPDPARWGGRSNCIYFAGKEPNNWVLVPLDEDFFSNGVIESPEHVFKPKLRLWPLPVWVYPSMLFSGTSN